jgi:acyl-coenzyme A synthetase/AMP-(fatty) acid ligase
VGFFVASFVSSEVLTDDVFFRQTETGSIVITPFPGAVPTKPGCATVPFFGHEPAILDAVSGEVGVPALLSG